MPIITGSYYSEPLTGTAADDEIRGLDGNDTIDGAGGNDKLYGGPGDDLLYAPQRDFGGTGSALVEGGDGNDSVYVGSGSLVGGAAQWAIVDMGPGNDEINVFGQFCGGIFSGGEGDDTFRLSTTQAEVTLRLGSGGADTVYYISYSVNFPRSVPRIEGFDGADILKLGLVEILRDWDQSNPFAGGYLRLASAGGDTILQIDQDGGGDTFNDFVVLSGIASNVLSARNFGGYPPTGGESIGQVFVGVAAPDGRRTQIDATVGPDTIIGANSPNLILAGAGNDVISGAGAEDKIYGNHGEDTIDASGGADWVDAGAGADWVYAGAGVDWVDGGEGNDIIRGGEGADTLLGSAGDDAIYGDDGVDQVDGGDGLDTAYFTESGLDFYVSLIDGTVRTTLSYPGVSDTLKSIENVVTGGGADTIVGDSRVNNLVGGAGADFLSGGGGDDTLDGGFGLDVIWGGAGSDTLSLVSYSRSGLSELKVSLAGGRVFIDGAETDIVMDVENVFGGAGADTISGDGNGNVLRGADGGDHLLGDAGTDTIDGGGGSNYLRGGIGDDIVLGGADFDDAHGNEGNDTVHGGAGDDWSVGGKDNDLLYGDEGGDIVLGNLGNDTCDGGAGADVVRGGQADDVLLGGAGDDWLSGDRGSDTLTGGGGADIFNSFGDAGLDRVADFSRGEGDRVRLDAGSVYSVAQVGADTVVAVTGGAQMVLVGVHLSTLTEGWIFVG